MRFRLLGPLEVWHDGQQLAVGGPQQRALLGALLLNANRVVSADRLTEHLWGERCPPTAPGLLRGCIAGLRRVLLVDTDGGPRQPLVTRAPGYLLEVGPGELDLDRFEELAEAAARLSAQTDSTALERCAALLREALSLWRGRVLEDITPDGYQAEALRLEERRLSVLEERIDVELRLGRYAHLVAELQVHVAEHPLREKMWAQLMLALYGVDRRADALSVYRRMRQNLVEELGVEPGATLQRLQHALLSDTDPFEVYRSGAQATSGTATEVVADEPAQAPHRSPPAQLPAEPVAFTGRDRHLRQLDDLGHDTDAPVCVITGTAGVGKTALAVRWAHRIRDRFPDGQLYFDLRGYAPAPPVQPIDALAGLLQGLGVQAEQVPLEVAQAAAMYRTLLADRRVLLLLDNARSAEQVRPLLPGGRGCVVLVTSRDKLAGLVARDGARHLSLDVLTPEEAGTLLTRLLGPDRTVAEPAAVAELAWMCALLPLAIRIAAANITCRPHLSVADQVSSMHADRLGALQIDSDEQSAVRAAIDLSYAALDDDARRLLRLLGLVPGPDVGVDAAAALAGTTPRLAARLLEQLAGAHLLGRTAVARYAFHDLLRAYAIERVHEEDEEPGRAVAMRRLLDWYLHAADAAARLLSPEKLRLAMPPAPAGVPPVPFSTDAAALSWLDEERVNLRAAVQHAAEHGPRQSAWLLADALRGYFWHRMYLVDWLAVTQAAMRAARAAGDLHAQAAAELSLADAGMRRSRYAQAAERYNRALSLAQRCGWLEGQAAALGNLGVANRQAGQLNEAASQLATALALNQRTGWVAGQAANLTFLGRVYLELGRLSQVADHHTRALGLFRQIGSRYGEAISLTFLGETSHSLGRFDQAIEELDASLALYREVGNVGSEADALRVLAAVHRDAGRNDLALELANAAVDLARDMSDRRGETDALNTLATVYLHRASRARAVEHHEHALRLATEIHNDYSAACALIGLANAHGQLTQPELAQTSGHRALTLV